MCARTQESVCWFIQFILFTYDIYDWENVLPEMKSYIELFLSLINNLLIAAALLKEKKSELPTAWIKY